MTDEQFIKIRNQALEALTSRDFSAAESLFRHALQYVPSDFDTMHMLGAAYFFQGRFNEAESAFERALLLLPNGHGFWEAAVRKNLGIAKKEARKNGDFKKVKIIRESEINAIAKWSSTIIEEHLSQLPDFSMPGSFGYPQLTSRIASAPAIRAFELLGAIALPDSSLPCTEEFVVLPDVVDLKRHWLTELEFLTFRVTNGELERANVVDDIKYPSFEAGIVVTSRNFNNWAHFLTETLPMIIIADNIPRWQSYPLIVSDEGLPNAFELIKKFIRKDRKVIRARGKVRLALGAYLTSCSWTPYEYKYEKTSERPPMDFNDFVFHPSALQMVRSHLMNFPPSPAFDSTPRERIFICRPNTSRKCNQPELERCARKYGFELISPEKLCPDEQIDIFSRAKTIVGQCGAGLANMIFAPPNCNILAYTGFTPHANHYYWRTIAHHLNISYREIYSSLTAVREINHPGHPDFHLDVSSFEQALQETLLLGT